MESKASLVSKIVALLCVLFSIVLILKFDVIHAWLVEYTSINIMEEEGEIMNPRRIAILKIGLVILILLGFLLSTSLFLNLHKKLYDRFSGVIDIDRINGIFFLDEHMKSNGFAIKTFIFSTLFAGIIHLRQLIFGDDVKEDIFEHISEVFFLLSSILFFVVIFKLKYLNVYKKERQLLRILFFGFGFGLLFIFLEEISYGQHIFEWETSGVFETYNFQGETNLHNFINPFYRFIYPLVGFGLFGACGLLWFFNKGNAPLWLSFLTPHKSLIILVFLMAASTYKGHSESFEHMLALFLLLYVWRILIWLNNLKKNKI